ncbi:hypothetical protein Tco_0968928 [Tanacetum coccineum]
MLDRKSQGHLRNQKGQFSSGIGGATGVEFSRCLSCVVSTGKAYSTLAQAAVQGPLGLHVLMNLFINRSELGMQDHSNAQSSSKLVPKVVPSSSQRQLHHGQELGYYLFHLHITMLRATAQDKESVRFSALT